MKRRYHLEYKGEIRHGLPYFQLVIDGVLQPAAAFGNAHAELGGGRYLAVEEWLGIEEDRIPTTRVAIFDLQELRVARLDAADEGVTGDFRLEDGMFRYRRHYPSDGRTIEMAQAWDSVASWEAFEGIMPDRRRKES